MTATFERVICYEDRGSVQTHSWWLEGVKTTPTGNTDHGRLWADFIYSGSTYQVDLYKSPDQQPTDKVASGQSESLGEIDLSEENSSGLTGQLYWEDYIQDQTGVVVYVSLATDGDVQRWWRDYTQLSGYDGTYGLAEYHAWAMGVVLDSVSRRFAEELGGYGAVPWWQSGAKLYPDLRRVANPECMRDAQALCVLYQALGADVQRSGSVFADQRDYFQSQYAQAVGNLLLSIDADVDGSADYLASQRSRSWQRK